MGITTMHRFKIVLSSIATLLVLGGAALFYSGSSVADDRGERRRHKDIDVTWSPSVLNFSVKPGETVSLPVTFTARERIDDGTIVYASTSLKDIVKVSPTTFGPLRKGQVATVTVTATLPISATPTTINGFLQLYDDGKRWKGKRERIEKRLPVTINVVWSPATDSRDSLHFSYPPSWTVETGSDGSTTVVGELAASHGESPESLSGICKVVVRSNDNPANLPLVDWLNAVTQESGAGQPQSLVPTSVGGYPGIIEVRDELGITETAFVSGRPGLVATFQLTCGDDVVATGTDIFQSILSSVIFN